MAIDNELRHLGDATSLVVERMVGPVEGMHRAISGSAFRYVGPPGRPVQAVHDSMVGGVYAAVRRGAGLLGAGASLLLANRMNRTSPISESSKGSGVQAALNGVWGDELAARGNHLAVELSIRVDGSAVAVDRASLAAAYSEASNHIVILLHGLGQTERCWEPGLPDRLAEDSLATPVLVRYNSGLSVERTGTELADLVDSLFDNWPVAQPRVSLVGYSMGGLVARSAYAAGTVSGHGWTRSAGDLITVGAPHHGSPVARGARIGSRVLKITATTRPLGEFIETSSAGIKDLDDGAGVVQAWEAAGADTSEPIRQHFLAGVVTGHERHPFGVVAGDLIVRVASAAGRSLGPRNVRVLGRRRHFSLLSDPDVLDQVIDWLGEIGD